MIMNNQLNDKIRIGEKITFFMANMGNIPIMTLISAYLLIFYTDVVGLSAAAIGTLFLITKILDGINDPIIGFILDRLPRMKHGKFKTLLFIGAIICSINFALLWYGPALAPDALKIVIAYITYILIGITFDVMDIALNSLIPVMTSDMRERSALSSIKGGGYMLGTVIVSVCAPLVINGFATQKTGFFILIGITTILVLCFTIIGAIGVKERVKAIKEENYSLKQLISFLTLGPVLAAFVSQLLFISGKAILTASEVYFATYIIGNLKIVSVVSIFMLLGMIAAVCITGLLVRKSSKRFVYGMGTLIFGSGIMIRLFQLTNTMLIFTSYIVVGFGAGLVMVLMYGIQADNIDYVEYKKGIRAEAAISSLQSFVAKAGGALGAAVPAYILSFTGYIANAQQTSAAKTGIAVSTLVIPAVFCIAAAAVFLFAYKLDQEQLNEIEKELGQLRIEKSKN